MMKIDFRYITKNTSLEKIIDEYKRKRFIGVDIETMGKNPLNPREGEIRLIQISAMDVPTLIVDWTKVTNTSRNMIKDLLESNIVKVFHNGKFDIKFLKTAGITIDSNIFDTYLAAGVLVAGLKGTSLKLDNIVKQYLDIELSKEEQRSNWASDKLTDKQLEYAAKDAYILLPLRKKLIEKLEEEDLIETAKLEFDAIPAIVEMELNGVEVDKKKLSTLKEELTREKEDILNKLKKYFSKDFNANSPRQVLKELNNMGIKVQSTKHEVLSQIAPKYEAVRLILDYKNIDKKLQFAKKIPQNINPNTGKIYSQYFQLGAATGRLSCTDFNLQQVPHQQEFRDCFVPSKGNIFVIADYSQMQIRIAAEISKDYEMIEAYQRGDDLHTLTAALVSGESIDNVTKEMRKSAKALNFGMLFGMGAKGLVTYAWSSYGVKLTEDEASDFIYKFFKKYSGLKNWQKIEGRKNTKESRTLGGRRRLFDTQAKYTQLVNNPVQGTESDILKKVLSILPNILRKTSGKLVACIHDEIIVECRKDDGDIVACMLQTSMEKVGEIFLKEVPVIAEATIASSWAEK